MIFGSKHGEKFQSRLDASFCGAWVLLRRRWHVVSGRPDSDVNACK